MRNDQRHPETWGLPGGKIEAGESLGEAIVRECEEELGFVPDYVSLVPLEKFTSVDGKFVYHTFFACVADEFKPTLNDEHIGYAWINAGVWPKPMHPGLWNTVTFDAIQSKIDVIRSRVKTSITNVQQQPQ